MKEYNLCDTEMIEFEKYLSELQKTWEANAEYFSKLRSEMGIRSTQIMSILALEIINSRMPEEREY